MNLATAINPTTGGWYRTGDMIVIDDPFAPPLPEHENNPKSGMRKRPGPSDAQRKLLKRFLGFNIRDARARLASFWVPPGLTAETLRWYRGIALGALAKRAKATPHARIVQRLRLRLVERALRVVR